MASAPLDTPMAQMNLDNTVFAFTKIMWLNMAKDIVQSICTDPLGNLRVQPLFLVFKFFLCFNDALFYQYCHKILILLGKDSFACFCKTTSSLYQNHFNFLLKFATVANAGVSSSLIIIVHALLDSYSNLLILI